MDDKALQAFNDDLTREVSALVEKTFKDGYDAAAKVAAESASQMYQRGFKDGERAYAGWRNDIPPKLDDEQKQKLEDILKRMSELRELNDPEQAHIEADSLLCRALNILGFCDISDAFYKVGKWYS